MREISRDSRSRENKAKEPAGEMVTGGTQVLAWWKNSRRDCYQGEEADGEEVHIYTTHVKPTKPLAVGERVQLLALPKAAPTTPGANLNAYKAYDPHVIGEVWEIEEAEEGWATVKIRNRCRGNAIERVELEIVYIAGNTVQHGELRAARSDSEWDPVELPMESLAHLQSSGRHEHLGHRGHLGRRGAAGESGDARRSVRMGRNGVAERDWMAERNGMTERHGRPDGAMETHETVGRHGKDGRGQVMCGAEECGLDPLPGRAEGDMRRRWKVMEKRVRRTVPTHGLEGTLKMHMWLKYDWAK